MAMMKYRLDVKYGEAKKPKPNYKWEERTYGFKTKEELMAFQMGIQAGSYVFDFDLETKEWEENEK